MTNNLFTQPFKGLGAILSFFLLMMMFVLVACNNGTSTPTAEPEAEPSPTEAPTMEEETDETSSSSADNATIAVSALTQVFDAQDASLVDTYYSDNYIQHSPQVQDGKAGLLAGILEMSGAGISINRNIARVIAEGDLVAIHSQVEFVIDGESTGTNIIVDMFRVTDGLITEHWDVVQEETPQAETVNGNSMIDGGGDTSKAVSADDLERNKQTVIDFIEKGFAGDAELLDSLFGEEYIQHNPYVPNGKEAVLGFLENGGFPAEVKYIMAQGDLVGAFVKYGDTSAAFDIFRMDDNGKVVEHWDVGQDIPTDAVHDNGFFGDEGDDELSSNADDSTDAVEEAVYTVDGAASSLTWTGSKPIGKSHTGTVQLNDGQLVGQGETFVSGAFTIDMTTIADNDGQARLENHLKSEDFFGVENYPTASLEIVEATPTAEGYDVTANLTIKEITNEISFPAVVTIADGSLNGTATIVFDRSRWDVRYGSGSFFSDLGDNLIDDEITLEVVLVANS